MQRALLLAPELELFAEPGEPLQPQQLLDRLLAFTGVHILQASELLLLDEAGVAQVIAIEIVELVQDALIDGAHPADGIHRAIRPADRQPRALGLTTTEDALDCQLVHADRKAQLD